MITDVVTMGTTCEDLMAQGLDNHTTLYNSKAFTINSKNATAARSCVLRSKAARLGDHGETWDAIHDIVYDKRSVGECAIF